jgi:nitrogen-specific signal transduction histidine kinase/ActR/RegA family two-component response regulator
MEISRSPLESEGGLLVLAAIRDLTDRKKLEQQVQHAQKMDAIGRLAGGIAHDFNNLLAAMMSFTNFALESLPETVPARDDLGEVLRAAERAKALIRQLLAFSRQQVIDPRVVDARGLLAGMEKLLRRVLGEDVELYTRASPDLWAIELDPSQFEQIAVNLAANARDAMPEGGRLTIELDNFELDEDYAAIHPGATPGSYVRLSVSDTGTGMPDSVRARIFEPFFTTKAAGHGSGLGLATCYGIMRQLGGYILAYSEPGRGTTMTVYFPRAAAERVQALRSTAPPAARGGIETVLVVEDDPAVRAAAVRSLKRRGYTVLEAGSAAAALSLSALHEEPIDVLLTDLVMPNMGGRELAAQLVIERPELRVVYMSGYAEHAVFQHGVLEPGLVFVQKPFVPDELARRIREALDAPVPERPPASA